ncbi:MAG: DHH family phosphoesterase [Candidatus Pacearchaeota archaeon]|jgi:nanoRNase/pAp phosphatase (c-di-AMP/oligoRNAs hydrolase)
MEFIIGSKNEFLEFLKSINKDDNVAILTHTDLDGIASGVFLEKILESRKIPVKLIRFIEYENDVLKRLSDLFKENNISKLFISDVSIDDLALDDFENLKKQMDIFLIDHHPINPLLKNKKNIIKTKSEDCAAFTIYNLGKDFLNQDWKELVCATMIAEFSYNDEDNLKFIQNIYPKVNKNNILESEPGKIYAIISSALIYYPDNLKKVYDLVLKNEIKDLEKCYNQVQLEIKKELANFWEKAEYFPNKKLYFYYFNNKLHIKSIVATNVSIQKPHEAFVIIAEDDKEPDMLLVSARSQDHSQNMGLLLKEAIHDLKNANAGGHIPAAGARFEKKDLDKFKENLLK